MFCRKCGAQLNENAKFCVKCGNPVEQAPESSVNQDAAAAPLSVQPIIQKNFDVPITKEMTEEAPGKHRTGKVGLIAALAAVFMLLAGVAAGSYFFFFSGDAAYERLLKKAEASVENEDYDAAIGYYLQAVKLVNNNDDAYIALADVYEMDDDIDKAMEVLETGLEYTKSKTIEKRLTRLQKSDREDAASASESGVEVNTEIQSEADKPYTGVRQNIHIEVRQVDTSNFPEIALYTSITDETGNTMDGLKAADFVIQEIAEGRTTEATMEDVYRVVNKDHINMNLVMDASGSMYEYSKMTQAKNAANALVNQMKLTGGDQVEVISFDDYVYLEQEFTNNQNSLNSAIDSIEVGGSTALYDALYAGLYQTYYEKGAKCVIGFTDGAENASSYSYQDVIDMSKNTGIPVFIIGIGEEYDADALQNLASECSGQYYSANVGDLESILEDIYLTIYREQQDYYVIRYKTPNTEDKTQFRDVVVQTSESSEFTGYYKKAYVPEADMTGAFSGSYVNKDYMIDDSAQRAVTEADLSGMSLAELRIARNEIFARHGRQFKDSMLNQWFYSKTWYLNIPIKYAPADFDKLSPSPLTRLEIDNANFILNYEQSIMETQDIYPNASNAELSEYDLALSKPVLKKALQQMNGYPSTAVLEENKRLVEAAVNKADVEY